MSEWNARVSVKVLIDCPRCSGVAEVTALVEQDPISGPCFWGTCPCMPSTTFCSRPDEGLVALWLKYKDADTTTPEAKVDA